MTVEPALVDFVRRIYVHDESEVYALLGSTVSSDFNQDDFIVSLMQLIDTNKISSFQVLILLSNLKSNSQIAKQIKDMANNYLVVIMGIPDIFQPNFTISLIALHFLEYFLSNIRDWDWIDFFIDLMTRKNEDGSFEAENGITMLVKTIALLAQKAESGNFDDAALYIDYIYYFISNDVIRYAFVTSEYFESVFRQLLSQSIFPHDRSDRTKIYFKTPEGELNRDILREVDTLMRKFHDNLFKLLQKLLAPNSRQLTLSLLGKLVNDTEKIAKEGFMNNNNQSTKYSEAIAYHLEYLLIHLVLFCREKMPNAIIDVHTPYNKHSITPITDETEMLATKGEISLWFDPRTDRGKDYYKDFKPEDKENYGALQDAQKYAAELSEVENADLNISSHALFLAWKCVGNVSFTFTNQIQHFTRIIQQQSRNERQAPNDFQGMQYKMVQQNLRLFINVLVCHLAVSQKYDEFIEFFNFSMEYLKVVAEFDNYKLPDKVPIAYAHIPKYALEPIVNVMHMMLLTIPPPKVDKILMNLAAIFSGYDYIRSIFIKAKIVEIFASIASNRNQAHLVSGLPHIADQMIPSVVRFFNDVQSTGGHMSYYDRFNFRHHAQHLLKTWFQYSEFRDFFVKHSQEEQYKNLVFHLVDDNIQYLSDAIALFQSISDKFMERSAQHGNEFMENAETAEVSEQTENLKGEIQTVMKSLELIERMTEFMPQIFNSQVVLEKLISLTIASLDLCIRKQDILDLPNKHEIGFIYDDFFTLVCKIIEHCNTEEFIQTFCSNERYYSNELLDDTIKQMHNVSMNSQLIEGFIRFTAEAKKTKQRLDDIAIDPDDPDVPEEFLDPVTYEVMKDPVILPGDEIVDRMTCENLIINKQLTPYTRLPIPEDYKAKPATELKQRIQEYAKRKYMERHGQKQ